MGWLKRLFGMEKPANPQQAISGIASAVSGAVSGATTAVSQSVPAEAIPPERIGLSGEYDQSGLAKRVALAFDEDPQLDDIDGLYVAQTSGTVVLKGKVPSQGILDKMVTVARGVNGATSVETDQVEIG